MGSPNTKTQISKLTNTMNKKEQDIRLILNSSNSTKKTTNNNTLHVIDASIYNTPNSST